MFRQEREELSGQPIETRMAEWLRAIQLVVKKLYPEVGGFLKSPRTVKPAFVGVNQEPASAACEEKEHVIHTKH